MCNCNITDDISTLESYNDMSIEIKLSSPLNLDDFLTYNNILTDSPTVLSVIDVNENIFEVIALKSPSGVIFHDKIPNIATTVYVKRKVDKIGRAHC